MDKTTETEVISRAWEILAHCKETGPDKKTPVYTTFDIKSPSIPKIVADCHRGVYWRDFYYTVVGFGEAFPQDDLVGGGVLYRVSEVPCIDSANCYMEKVYGYKV